MYIDRGLNSYVLNPVNGDEIVPGTKKASTVQPDGELHEWVPYEMYFRAPSEHTFEGRHTDLELQFYHRTPEGIIRSGTTSGRNDWDGRRLDGKLMATSIFFDRLHGGNEDNPFIESLELDSENKSCQEALGLDPVVEDVATDAAVEEVKGWCLPNLDI